MTGPLDGGGMRLPDGAAVVESMRRHGRALALVVVLTVAGCAAGTWWQVQRALEGNLLSDLYSFLWPIYGCYVIYVSLRLRRGATTLIGHRARAEPELDHPDELQDEELQAYNRYLAANRATKRADAQRRGR